MRQQKLIRRSKGYKIVFGKWPLVVRTCGALIQNDLFTFVPLKTKKTELNTLSRIGVTTTVNAPMEKGWTFGSECSHVVRWNKAKSGRPS